MREKLSPGPGTQEPGEGRSKENSRVRAGLGKNTNPVRDLPGAAARLARRRRAGKKQTGRTALWAADALQDASRVTSLPVQTALRRDGACASCPPQVRVRARLGKDTNPVRELPTAAARACGAFSSYLSPFPVWLLLRKSLFICRSCRDGNFLACPLPRLCSRPEGLVTCCFFADFCTHCLFFRFALFARVFSLVFHLFLPNFFLSNFFSFVAQAATGLYFLPKRK